jgi:hypothetical protein
MLTGWTACHTLHNLPRDWSLIQFDSGQHHFSTGRGKARVGKQQKNPVNLTISRSRLKSNIMTILKFIPEEQHWWEALLFRLSGPENAIVRALIAGTQYLPKAAATVLARDTAIEV